MRRLFIYLLILAAAVVAALFFNQHHGEVRILLDDRVVVVNLLLTVLLLVFSVLLLYFIVSATARMLAVPTRLRDWQGRRRQESARCELTGGLLRFAEGDFDGAEQQLIRSARRSDAPLVNYLTAAIAAQRRGDQEARDEYLNAAERSGLGTPTAVQLLQAQLQIESGQWEEAQATVASILEFNPKQGRALDLMVQCCRMLSDWERLEPLLGRVERYASLPKEELREVQAWIARERLANSAIVGREALDRNWHELSRAARREPGVIGAYAEGLARNGDVQAAEELIRKQLQKVWDDHLLKLYARLPGSGRVAERLAQVEAWLETRYDDAQLLYVAGALALRAGQLDKAREHLTKAAERAADPQHLRALAMVQEQSGQLDAARATYREAMDLLHTEDPLPELLGLPGPAAVAESAGGEEQSQEGSTGEADAESTTGSAQTDPGRWGDQQSRRGS
ncbi:hypothetical protein CKO15_01680 [Halorhodospira abdelmalekii]|uniref:heme biosynthesis protein HemY n=1 Tax=Halorhodospira abdelmalekii TaxID=421629 RepID=UPI001906AA04|nr:heme biosynthesis HemY N-terminal domain-containing protein [Halorhodospira abdelmalekii]MBK1734011.1 hypothetical protein [Halorhodospira abdelmalekii]